MCNSGVTVVVSRQATQSIVPVQNRQSFIVNVNEKRMAGKLHPATVMPDTSKLFCGYFTFYSWHGRMGNVLGCRSTSATIAAYMADDSNGSPSMWALSSASVSSSRLTLNTTDSSLASLDSRFMAILLRHRANIAHAKDFHAVIVRY